MKWNALLFWLLLLIGLMCFFWLVNPFLFSQQEEMQLFIPEWHLIHEVLLSPGGFCTIAGQFTCQYYADVFVASLLNAVMFCFVGVLIFFLLEQISSRNYNQLLALAPVLCLLKMQLNPSFVTDGTIGFLVMLLFLYLSLLAVKTKKSYCLLAGVSILVYFLLGQLVIAYAGLFVLLCLITRKDKWYYSFVVLFSGCLLSYIGVRMSLHIPWTDGVYSLRYQESQFLPESFLYYAWIRLMVLSFSLFVVAHLFGLIPRNKLWANRLIIFVVFSGLAGYSIFCFLDAFDKQNRVLWQFAYLKKHQDWNGVVNLAKKTRNNGLISLNYLNMALAANGDLANKMFLYDQKGVQGLIAPWNGTYYMSALLSDIHFMIGDISVSESYAMEGLTLAKRGGSPRMLQRLLEISEIKNELDVTEKYLRILKNMPCYGKWVKEYEENTLHVKKANWYSPELEYSNQLLSQLDTELLWKTHLDSEPFNDKAFEYLGCSYLLSKDLENFITMINSERRRYKQKYLPVHFQEAVVVWAFESGASIPDDLHIEEKYRVQFDGFRQGLKKEVSNVAGLTKMYQRYGNTYWFYFYCKQL